MSDSGVIQVESFASYEQTFKEAILKELGPDGEALKLFEVKRTELTRDDRQALREKGMSDRLITVQGALGLDDSGINWRVFHVNIEEGLSIAQDKLMASTLAEQVAACVGNMKDDLETGEHVHHVN